jgi:hypothetical protein
MPSLTLGLLNSFSAGANVLSRELVRSTVMHLDASVFVRAVETGSFKATELQLARPGVDYLPRTVTG